MDKGLTVYVYLNVNVKDKNYKSGFITEFLQFWRHFLCCIKLVFVTTCSIGRLCIMKNNAVNLLKNQ